MALAASGRFSATGSPSVAVVVESMSMLFGRRVGWTDKPRHLGVSFEGAASGSEVLAKNDSAAITELKTRFPLQTEP